MWNRIRLYKAPYIHSVVIREFMAEFLGICVLCVIGNGSIAQQVVTRKQDFLSINIAYGVAVTFGVYVAFGVSGGHINPAITISQAVIGKFPWPKVPVFIAAHYLGGFVSAIIVYFIYLDGIHHIDSGAHQVTGENATAGIFATYPEPYVSNWTAFFDQVVGTALLMIGVLSLTNEKNVSLRVKSLEPLLIGFLVAAIGMSYGANCGYALNPARDLGPRIFTAMVGYGAEVFHARHWFFWIPVVGPHVGAIVGSLVYKLLVGMHFAYDVDLIAGADGDDIVARVGKGEAKQTEAIGTDTEDIESGRHSPSPSPSASPSGPAAVRRPARRQLTVAPEYILGNQNAMWQPNTYVRQQTLAPQRPTERKVVWRQLSARPELDAHMEIELADIPEVVPPASRVRSRVVFPSVTESKRPAV